MNCWLSVEFWIVDMVLIKTYILFSNAPLEHSDCVNMTLCLSVSVYIKQLSTIMQYVSIVRECCKHVIPHVLVYSPTCHTYRCHIYFKQYWRLSWKSKNTFLHVMNSSLMLNVVMLLLHLNIYTHQYTYTHKLWYLWYFFTIPHSVPNMPSDTTYPAIS